MKVIVNLPDEIDSKEILENRVADFHATLLIEKIRQLNINDKSKEKLLNIILDNINEKCTSD